MIAAVSTHLFAHHRLRSSNLEWIAAAGFDAIELWGAEHHFAFYDDAAAAELRAWLAATGLRVASIHLPFQHEFGSPEFRYVSFADPRPENRALMGDKAVRWLDVGESFGCQLYVLHPTATRVRGDATDRRLRPALDWLAPQCERRGARIALENIMLPGTRAGALTKICCDYGGRVGVCLDVGHAHIDGGLIWEIANAGDHLLALHAHDNHGEIDEHLPPGRGTIDWSAASTALRWQAPNAGLFTFELNGAAVEDDRHERDCRAKLGEAMAFWRRFAERVA